MLHPVKLNESTGILKTGLMERYSRLHIDNKLYKKAKYDAPKLIAAKKQAFFDEKLSESIGKVK